METVGEISLSITVENASEYANAFAAYLADTGRSPRTIAAYLQDVRKFAGWYMVENGQAFAPEKMTSLDLRGFRKHALDRERCSAATWNRRRIALKVFCGWLVESGALSYDPFRGIEAVRIEDPGVRALDKSERNKFLRQVEISLNAPVSDIGKLRAIRDQAMIGLMIFAGLRESEVVGLDAADVELRPRSGEVSLRRGKGDKFRQVPLGPEARQALRMWLERRPQVEGPLFPGKNGGRLSTRQVQRVVAELGRLAGLEMTPHDLRHTFATILLNEKNESLAVAQKILGHQRSDTTMRYAKPTWKHLQEAVEKI